MVSSLYYWMGTYFGCCMILRPCSTRAGFLVSGVGGERFLYFFWCFAQFLFRSPWGYGAIFLFLCFFSFRFALLEIGFRDSSLFLLLFHSLIVLLLFIYLSFSFFLRRYFVIHQKVIWWGLFCLEGFARPYFDHLTSITKGN